MPVGSSSARESMGDSEGERSEVCEEQVFDDVLHLSSLSIMAVSIIRRLNSNFMATYVSISYSHLFFLSTQSYRMTIDSGP